MTRFVAILLLMLLAAAPLRADAAAASQAEPEPERALGAVQHDARLASLVGTWRTTVGSEIVRLTFHDDGRFSLDDRQGTFRLERNNLHVHFDDTVTSYQFSLPSGNELTLTGGDLADPVTFTRQLDRGRAIARLFDVPPEILRDRLYRVLFIIVVVLLARLGIALAKLVSRLIVTAQRGPLRFLYRGGRNRAGTIHALALNLVKYFVYFTALGMILSELGIHYAAYLASLSVIGLAIGFGSQGLVQDMVTGFFIIFEGQFDVGDVVEISGQTGVVTELGLRMTRLRNYLGQDVVIPNRNIAMVGNYRHRAQLACVEVAIADAEAAEPAKAQLDTLARELARQFDGVVLGEPRVAGPTTLATGEQFVRLELPIWPGQTWLIDQQLLPRLRELFARQELSIPADRVAVFYHGRELAPVTRWRLPLSRITHPAEPTDRVKSDML
ncbi:MAG: mechanosensitive ion channel domain-containing protein [Phycisphaeraceae bacterium]